jgi:hypothetical protein
VREAARGQLTSIEALRPEGIADAVSCIVTQDRRVAINEILIRAAEQNWQHALRPAGYEPAADTPATGHQQRDSTVPSNHITTPSKLIILAAYTCRACDIQGRDPEVSPGLVLCWNCGRPALITARVSG